MKHLNLLFTNKINIIKYTIEIFKQQVYKKRFVGSTYASDNVLRESDKSENYKIRLRAMNLWHL